MAYEHQQEITKHNLLIVSPVKRTVGRNKYLRMRIEAIESDLMTGASFNLDDFNDRFEMAHYRYNWKTGKAELVGEECDELATFGWFSFLYESMI